MKCLVLFFISLGLAMSFPPPPYRDAEDLKNQMAETELNHPWPPIVKREPELNEPGRRSYMTFGNTAGNVG